MVSFLSEWLTRSRATLILEENRIDEWLYFECACMFESIALDQVMPTTGLSSRESLEEYLSLLHRHVTMMSDVLSARNERIARQMESHATAHRAVLALFGTAHRGVCDILETTGVHVTRPMASRLHGTDPLTEVIIKYSRRESLEEAFCRKVYLQHIVQDWLLRFAPGIQGVQDRIANDFVGYLKDVSAVSLSWSENDVLKLARAIQAGKGETAFRDWARTSDASRLR
jgi:hypothetical protein